MCVSRLQRLNFTAFLVLVLFINTGLTLQGQSVSVKGTIDGWGGKTIFLQEYEGYRSPNVDTAITDVKGNFIFSHTPAYYGLHRILIENSNNPEDQVYIDVILDGNDLSLSAQYPNLAESLVIAANKETKALHSFLRQNEELSYRQIILEELLEGYPVSNDFTKHSRQELKAVISEKDSLHSFFMNCSENPITAEYIKVWKSFEKTDRAAGKEDYWRDIDLSSGLLLRTNVVSQKMLDYFKLYQADLKNPAAMQNFIDNTLDPQFINLPLWENSFEFLKLGFTQIGEPSSLQYLKTKLEANQSCENPLLVEDLNSRIERTQGLEINAVAPGFSLPNENGQTVSLEVFKGSPTLLIFWSPDCPHCVASIDDWRGLAEKRPELKIVTVAIYNDVENWKQFLEERD